MACRPPTPATSPEPTGWRTVLPRSETWFVCSLFCGFAIPGLLAIQLPLVIADAGHRPFRVGAVIACQNGGIVLAPLWGWMADRLRLWRGVLVGSLVLIGLSFAGLAVERGLNDLMMSGFLLGAGAGACNTMMILLVTKTTARESWPGAFASLQMLGAIGSVAGFAVAGLIGSSCGMLTAAALSIPAILAATRAPPADACPARPGLEAAGSNRREGGHSFAIFLATWLLFSIAVSAFSSFYPITMARNFQIGVGRSSAVLALATLVSLPLYAAVGRRAQRSGPAALFVTGVVGRAGVLVVLASLPIANGLGSMAAIGCAGLFQAIWPVIGVTSSALAARLAPRHEGAAVGAFQATGSIASGLGALLSGAIADRYGYQDVLAAAAMVAIAAVLCSFGLYRAVRVPSPVSPEGAD